MSGFAGILRFDGQEVDGERLGRMAAALAYRVADHEWRWQEGRCGAVQRHFATTPEDTATSSVAARGGVRVAAHARIDNRAELAAELGDAARLGSDELILAAYERWGEECFARLVGDWAAAVWDSRRDRLLLARDPMGLRQIFYTVRGESLVFGSTAGAVLAALDSEPPLNEPLVREFLRGRFEPWLCETVYADVLRLPPAHLLAIGSGVGAPRLFYELGRTWCGTKIRDEEWVDAFHETLDEAIRCRLRTPNRTAILTSGGVDSSALACEAHNLVRGTDLEERVELLNLAFERTPAADEAEYLQLVLEHCREMAVRSLPGDDLWAMRAWLEDPGYPVDEPEVHLLRAAATRTFDELASNDCRVVLSGEGCNQVLGDSIYRQPSALRAVPLRHLPSELPFFVERSGRGPVALLIRAAAATLLPRRVANSVRSLARKRRPWVLEPRSDRYSHRRPDPHYLRPEGLDASARVAHDSLRNPHDLARHGAFEVSAARAGVELRTPFLDRRLVDLALALPHRLRCWRGEDRRVLRRAMAGRMPERLRTRTSRSHAEDLVDRGLKRRSRQLAEELLDTPLAARLNFVDSHRLRRHFDSYQQGLAPSRELTTFFCLEFWLRHRR